MWLWLPLLVIAFDAQFCTLTLDCLELKGTFTGHQKHNRLRFFVFFFTVSLLDYYPIHKNMQCCLKLHRTFKNCLHAPTFWCSLTVCFPSSIFIFRKRPPIKSKKSPVGSWRSFFNLGKSSSMSKRKLHRNPSEPNELKAMALAGKLFLCNIKCFVYLFFCFCSLSLFNEEQMSVKHVLLVFTAGGRGDTATLRSAKSEESLSSLHNVEGNYYVQPSFSSCRLFFPFYFGICKFDKAVWYFCIYIIVSHTGFNIVPDGMEQIDGIFWWHVENILTF